MKNKDNTYCRDREFYNGDGEFCDEDREKNNELEDYRHDYWNYVREEDYNE